MTDTLSTRLDYDHLNSLPRDEMSHHVHSMLAPLSNQKGEVIMAATAILFAVMVTRYSGSPEGLFEYGKKILNFEEDFHKKENDSFESLRDFAKMRINHTPVI